MRNVSADYAVASLPNPAIIYMVGNVATPHVLARKLAERALTDSTFRAILYCCLPMGNGDLLPFLFSPEVCEKIDHRLIFAGPVSRDAVNQGRAHYCHWHLSQVPHYLERAGINTVFLQIAGNDECSFGVTIEHLPGTMELEKRKL